MRPQTDANAKARTRTKKNKKFAAKPANSLVHTKRKEIVGEDGWVHIVDKPRSKQPDTQAKKQLLQGGDFEIKGVSYIHRTLGEMKEDVEHWKRSWEERPACEALTEKLKDVENDRNIENVVVLGLGSLQSPRREGRRSSATQLAALQSIVSGLQKGSDFQVIFQDPQYTKLDREFLASLGYKVVEDPEAFAEVGEGSLVYAIHCYADVYKSVAERPRPAVLIGTDVSNFVRFDASEDSTAKDLAKMVEGFEMIDFPQLRHDFSDTKIYLRRTTKVISATIEGETKSESIPPLETNSNSTPAAAEHNNIQPPSTEETSNTTSAPLEEASKAELPPAEEINQSTENTKFRSSDSK